jgi:hypothetical protein
VEPLPIVDDLDDDNQIHELELAEMLAGRFQNEELLGDATAVGLSAV